MSTKEEKYFGWSEWKPFIDGWIPKFSFFVPLLGYFILFNDTVINFLKLNYITGNMNEPQFVSWKVYGLYFGLFFLGISNIYYQVRKPDILRIGKDKFQYSENALRTFSFVDFHSIYENLNNSDFEVSWAPFKKDYQAQIRGNLQVVSSLGVEKNWRTIIAKHEEYLRDLLLTVFCVEDAKRKKELLGCITVSILGYTCLAIVLSLIHI